MNTKITINTIIERDIEKVWELYTDPKHIINWNFASNDWCCPKAENEMKIGGFYNVRMEAKDKSFGFDLKAIYTEITLLKSFSYTLEDDRKVNTTFENIDLSTKITIVFEAENQNPIDMQKAGWQNILNNFKNYAENSINII